MSAMGAILRELDQEAKTTRRVLERAPEDKLGWKPHAKSLGNFGPPEVKSRQEILDALEEGHGQREKHSAEDC
jgi:hypothetical protein